MTPKSHNHHEMRLYILVSRVETNALLLSLQDKRSLENGDRRLFVVISILFLFFFLEDKPSGALPVAFLHTKPDLGPAAKRGRTRLPR